MTTSNKLNIGLLVLVGILFFLLTRSCENAREATELYNATQDTLSITKDELGREIASIQVLEADNEKALLNLKTKDSTIQWLQDVVEEYKGKLNTGIVISNTTASTGGVETIVLNTADTVWKDSVIYLYPVYKSTWDTRWETGEITATKDSIFRSIKVRNEFEITQGLASNGWFKKREYTVQVKNLNPNTFTTELRSFSVSAKPKRFTLGIQAGYGVSLRDFQPTPYLGVGVGFTLIGIK